jgi:uncharacterized membrane protein
MEEPMANPRSTASIAGHPIHPMLVPFPIAFFIGALACDLAYWQTNTAGWATAAMWLIGAGLIMAAAAAVAGLVDFLGDRMIRTMDHAWWHAGGNVVLVLVQLYSWYARYTEGAAAVMPKGLVLSLVAFGIILFTGWKGGEMVYRYRVGVREPDAAVRPAPTVAHPRRAA